MSIKDVERYEKWLKEKCPNKIGEDRYYGWTANSDIFYLHRCNGKLQLGTINVTKPIHTLVQREPLHVEPSILCSACNDHGYIRDGTWMTA